MLDIIPTDGVICDTALQLESLEALKREQTRRYQQRRRMVAWRIERKNELTAIREEREQLEAQLQRLLFSTQLTPKRIPFPALHRAILEGAALKREKLLLQEAIHHQIDLEGKLKHQADEFLDDLKETSRLAAQTGKDSTERWIFFPNGEPPAYFYPLTKELFMEKVKRCQVAFEQRHPCTATIGNMFGWTVDYALPIRQPSGSTIAHARFSRRFQCSLDAAVETLRKVDPRKWPVILSARSFGRAQCGDIYYQPLQTFSDTDRVMICNIPGEVHLRCIALAHFSTQVLPNGRRSMKHSIVVVDSEENARNRVAEGPQDKVQWVLEGGEVCTITEVDDKTIQVEHDQWSECISEAYGTELYVDWIRFAVRLGEFISPVKFLQS
eukprot:jgi/Phyca11/115716/e_gw1.29.331.1